MTNTSAKPLLTGWKAPGLTGKSVERVSPTIYTPSLPTAMPRPHLPGSAEIADIEQSRVDHQRLSPVVARNGKSHRSITVYDEMPTHRSASAGDVLVDTRLLPSQGLIRNSYLKRAGLIHANAPGPGKEPIYRGLVCGATTKSYSRRRWSP